MICKLLRSKKGEGHLGVIIGVVALAMFIVVALNIFTFISLKTSLDRIADDLIEVATYSGAFGEDFNAKVDQMKEKYFDFELELYASEYFNEEEKRVQMGEDMGITIKVNALVSGIDIALPIDLTVSRIGQSEQYWRVAGGTYIKPEIDYTSKTLFILDTSKNEFHYPNCEIGYSVEETSREEVYSSAEELKALGYIKCEACQPHDCFTNTVTHFNVQGHWGYCETCGKQNAVEAHLWTYSEEMGIYYCEYCEAIEDEDGYYCCSNGARLTQSAHLMGCTCHYTPPTLIVNNLSTDKDNPSLLSLGTFRIAGMARDLEGIITKVTVNGQKATLFADGEWYFDFNYTSETDPKIKIVAIDESNMETVLYCYVETEMKEIIITTENKHQILDAIGVDNNSAGYTLSIPEYYYEGEYGYKIIGIADGAFHNDNNVGSVVITGEGRDYFTIGMDAFMYSSITSLDIESDVIKSIGNNAFNSCASLSEARIPYASYGEYAFAFSNIGTVNLSSSVTSLGVGMFYGCTSLSSIDLKNVACIEKEAFYESGISYIDLSNVTSIGDYAFAYSSLYRVAIPSLTDGWGEFAFSDCSNLSEVQILSGNTLVPTGTFWSCSSLYSVECPNSKISEIGPYAFYGCSSLLYFDFQEPMRTIGDYSFFDCGSLREIAFNSEIAYIGEYAFKVSESTVETTLFGNITDVIENYDWVGDNRVIK